MSSDEEDQRVPGYCVYGCGFHMVTPIPSYSGGVCGNCEQVGRLGLPPPPDRPRYSPRISWWQQRRLQRTAAEFWSYGDEEEGDSSFGAFFTGTGRWGYLLRYFLRRGGEAMTAGTPKREPVQCARPGCPEVFTPRHKDHIYCSVLCKKRVHAYRHVLTPRSR